MKDTIWWERIKVAVLLVLMFVFCMMISYVGHMIVLGSQRYPLNVYMLRERDTKTLLFGSAVGYAVGTIVGFISREQRVRLKPM